MTAMTPTPPTLIEQVVARLDNPYWDAVKDNDMLTSWRRRDDLVRRYAWAIPDPQALACVVEHLAPQAVELGAGTGYWASLLRQTGLVDIVALDEAPPGSGVYNRFHMVSKRDTAMQAYTEVSYGTAKSLRGYGNCTLFLCWPPYKDAMAAEALQHYPGKRLVYIGEDDAWGCTANAAFFDALAQDWTLIAQYPIARWDGIYDDIFVYERD